MKTILIFFFLAGTVGLQAGNDTRPRPSRKDRHETRTLLSARGKPELVGVSTLRCKGASQLCWQFEHDPITGNWWFCIYFDDPQCWNGYASDGAGDGDAPVAGTSTPEHNIWEIGTIINNRAWHKAP